MTQPTLPPLAPGVRLPRLTVPDLSGVGLDMPRDFSERMVEFTRGIQTAIREVGASVNATLADLRRVGARVMRVTREAANNPVHVAGLEATYAVRAGLSPHPPSPYLSGLVCAILRGQGHPDAPTYLLTRQNRSRVAAAALRGYVAGHPSPRRAGHLDPVPRMVEWTYGQGTTALAYDWTVR